MDVINNFLTTSSESPHKYSLAIRAALTIGKRTLSKYYNKTGESEVYRVAMSTLVPFYVQYVFLTVIQVLHPRHKLEYFRRHNWDEPSIEAARNIVQVEFNRSYCKSDVEGDNGTTPSSTNIVVSRSFSF